MCTSPVPLLVTEFVAMSAHLYRPAKHTFKAFDVGLNDASVADVEQSIMQAWTADPNAPTQARVHMAAILPRRCKTKPKKKKYALQTQGNAKPRRPATHLPTHPPPTHPSVFPATVATEV